MYNNIDCAPSSRGKGGGASQQRGVLPPSPVRAVIWFYCKRRPPYFQKGAHHGLCPLSVSGHNLWPVRQHRTICPSAAQRQAPSGILTSSLIHYPVFHTGAFYDLKGACHNLHGRRPCQASELFEPSQPSHPSGRVKKPRCLSAVRLFCQSVPMGCRPWWHGL